MKKLTTALLAIAMFALPVAAPAQDTGYGTPSGAVQATVDPGTGGTATAGTKAAEDEERSLPFTGYAIGISVFAGCALVAGAVVIRRATANWPAD